jgi:hypothetical protein
MALTVTPSGSTLVKGPITLSFGGPFQSRGASKLPASDFTISLGFMGNSSSLGILSTGTSGYATFEGESYRLPQAAFQKLETSFAALRFVPGSSRSSVLRRLGIQPSHWLVNPHVVGSETVGGAPTTHVAAGIDIAAFLGDLNNFLLRGASAGVAGVGSFSRGISAASRNRLARAIHGARLDLWTGVGDRTLRRLQIGFTVPVSGQLASALGSSAAIVFSLQYSDLNQPQTITAPSRLAPYSQFQSKLRAFFGGLTSGLGSAVSGGLSSSSAPGSGSSSGYQAYSTCIQSAGGSIAKMQKCAPLLSGGG